MSSASTNLTPALAAAPEEVSQHEADQRESRLRLSVAIEGLLCLGMVLAETIRYRRRMPGVNDQTTSKVLRIFHAPLGFIVTGFGMFMILLAAPLDNYWHVLYGIDV